MVLPLLWSTCDMIHCLGERELFSSSFVVVFFAIFSSNAPIMLYNIPYWWFFLFKVINEQNTLHIPKYRGQNLASWCLHLWSLWMAFICCCPLSWLLIWLWSEMVDSCFIHCHIFMQKLLFVALKLLQTTLWIIDALLFLSHCDQTWHPLWTQLSHWQIFM